MIGRLQLNHPTRGPIKTLFSNDFRILRKKVRDVNKNKERPDQIRITRSLRSSMSMPQKKTAQIDTITSTIT